MAGFSVHFEGLKELEAKLEGLAGREAEKIVRDGLRAGGEVIQAAIQERAPVRPTLPSGTALPEGALSRDIALFVGVSEEDGLPAAIIRPGTETAYAANWVEYGHREVKGGYSKVVGSRTRGPGKKIGNVPAHPFIRPGFEASASAAVEAMAASVAQGIDDAMKK